MTDKERILASAIDDRAIDDSQLKKGASLLGNSIDSDVIEAPKRGRKKKVVLPKKPLPKPSMGDKTPALVEWYKNNDYDEFIRRYKVKSMYGDEIIADRITHLSKRMRNNLNDEYDCSDYPS